MGKDYKNPQWIVQQFNSQCTDKGQQYLNARELDNEYEMWDAIVEFGIGLGIVSEWTVKYLLDRYDTYEEDDRSDFITLWKRLCCSSLKQQLIQLGFKCDSNSGNCITNYRYRESISNIVKHLGKIDDLKYNWNLCCKYYDELYRLINNFVYSNRTDNLRTIITGDEDWDAVFKLANGFNKNSDNKYILITDRPKCSDMLGIFRIPWSIILDFDFDSSEEGGLFYISQHYETGHLSEQYQIGNTVKKRSSLIHWVTVVQHSENREEIHDRGLANKISRKFEKFIASYHSYNSEPVIVVISMNDSRYQRSLNDMLKKIQDEYYNESSPSYSDAKFLLLCNSSIQVSQELYDDGVLYPFDINLQQLVAGAKKEIVSQTLTNENMLVPAKTDGEIRSVEINNEFYVRLSQFAELVYIGIENCQSENGTSSLDEFYRGLTSISWQMLARNTVGMRPSIYTECKTKLFEICKKPGSSCIKFYYKRGMGGTTCIRQLAYDVHENYPTIIITSYTKDSTADEIQKLYNLCKMPIVIFVDSNNLYNEEVEKLHRELKSRTFSFTIVHLIGVFEEYPKYQAYPKLVKFSEEDFSQLCALLNNNIQKGTKYQERLDQIKKINDASAMSPFLVNMHVFEDHFEGIDNFVQNTLSFPNLEGDNRKQIEDLKNVLFVTALASWAGFSVEEQFFSDAYGYLFTRSLKRLESPLAPLIVFETIGDSGYFRIRHFQFSKSILKIFSESNDNISFTKLTQRIVDFIRSTRKDDTKTKQEATLRLLVRLFINRDWDVSDVTESVSTRNQEVYSSLIKKLIDENKNNTSAQEMVYNPESDSIIRIYRTLTKCYPEEIHFHAHLARYYFYTAKDYENGFATVENAIKLAEDNIEYDASAVALVYHIKGMGYRSYINHLITNDLSMAMKRLQAYDANKCECSNQILRAIHEIQCNAQYADECFESSGKIGDSNLIYSLISSCQMRIQIQRSYNTLRNLSARLGLDLFVTDDPYIMNQTILCNKNEELQAWAVFFEGTEDSYSQRQETATKKISNIDVDVKDLTEEDSDTIKYCLQCLEDDVISDKSIYRQVIARKKYDEISTDFSSEENQKILLEIIALYESNIEENGGTRADICNWFTAKCQLDINKEIAIDVLEECEHKFDAWIEAGNTTRDIHLYRYIVHFLKYYEMNSLKSAESQKVLKELEAELKKHSAALVNKTAMVYWVGNAGYGLRRLISNRLFKQLSSEDKIRTLQMFEGKLPSRESFSQNTAYIYCSGQHVFFRPSAIKGRLTKDNADDFVSLGVGFSYDGLRSYHDSIVRITKTPISKPHFTGDTVTVKVIKHNTSWVECMVIDEDQPVIISRYDLKGPFDPEHGIWPEQDCLLEVILMEQRDYVLRGRYYDEHRITKKPHRAELL